jgi:hypothetical protein
MKKYIVLATTALIFSSCRGIPVGSVALDVQYSPATVAVTRTDVFDKTTKAFLGTKVSYLHTKANATFSTRAGSLGVFLREVRVQVRDGAGNPVALGFDRATQSVGVKVEPGLVCPTKPCSLGGKDTTFGQSSSVSSALTLFDKPALDVIAGEVAGTNAPGVRQYRSSMQYVGEDTNFQLVEIPTQDVTIEVTLNVTREEQ